MSLVATTVESCHLLPSLPLSLLDFYLFSHMSGPFSFGTPGTQPPVAAALTQHQLALGLSSPARSASQHQTGLANYGGGPLRPPQGQLNNTRAGISSETGALGRTVDLNEDDTPRVSNLDHGDTTDPPAADLISRDSAGLALFVDTVSNTYGFTGRDTGFRDSLHGFIKARSTSFFIQSTNPNYIDGTRAQQTGHGNSHLSIGLNFPGPARAS